MTLIATQHVAASGNGTTLDSLAGRLAGGQLRAVVTFAGQGVDPLDELAALVAQRPELRAGAQLASQVLDEVAASDVARATGAFRHGVDVAAWVADPDGAPPPAYLRGAAVGYPLSLLAQALLWRAVWADALAAAIAAGSVVALAGHSQGLLAALLVAEAPGGQVDDARLARHLRRAAFQGLHMAAAATGTAPMASIDGVNLAQLEPLLPSGATIALVNAPTRLVVAGPPPTLALLRTRLAEQAAREAAERKAGRRGGAPLRFEWTPVPVDVPFHSPALAEPLDRFVAWLGDERSEPMWAPVLCPTTGRELPMTLERAARAQFVEPVRWDAVAGWIADRADWVLDAGPGTAVARLTAENLRGSGVRTLALASPEGRRVLTSPGAAPATRDVEYAALAPGVVTLPDGRRHLDTRYTRATGRPPVILAGMTPTTVDAPIVAAAANAGYMTELAGGGQPDRRTFELRVEELAALLDPGREVVFNTLLLDRHLWALHVEADALLFGARRAGAPLAGLTVSAGIPDVEDAIALLDRLAAAGMRLNAFKPGTVEQVQRLLAIADAAPHHTIAAHLEGGRGGGHHSWEDLEELLLATYHELRRRENVLVCAGGGIGTPEHAAELLCGSWSLAHGRPAMPVDAVLVGTAAMACAESAASPQVKRALVAASGSEDWVPRGGATGGVTSARSNLNADIHLLENAAARAAHLLESVAGDAAAVAERRDEIVAALAATAKPYFGDLDAMTYRGVLDRFTELCAIGRGRRYDDGAWGHPSWRARALELYRRWTARLAPGPVAASFDLDDPAAALREFGDSHAAAATTLLHPADEQFFLAVCDGDGKPVPFVPVLDSEVRRWYMADALWQAQDDRLDADRVFVIPGPEAVAGITRADEPVAELLARFEAAAIARVEDEPVERVRLAAPGPAPEPLAGLDGGDGPVAALLAAQCVVAPDGTTRPNPLWRLLAPGDDIVRDAQSVVVRPAGTTFESVTIARDGGDALVTVDTGVAEPLALRFRPLDGGAVAELGGNRASASFADGRPAPVDDPLDGVQTAWECSPVLARAYRAATGATHDGVPLDLALTLAWPALAALLAVPELAARLAELVHVSHAVRPGATWPPQPGEHGTASARLVELRDPADGPTRLRCVAELTSARGPIAVVESELAILTDAPVTAYALRRRDVHEVTLEAGDAEFLASYLTVNSSVSVEPTCVTVEVPRDGAPRWAATGAIAGHGDGDDPVGAALTLLAPAGPERHARPAEVLAEAEDVAPTSMEAFARVGGDRNPLHRSVLAARAAGLPRPIVHGAWTAARAGAFVVDALCDGDAERLRDWQVRFLAPVALGEPLDFDATRVALVAGRRVVGVRVRGRDGDVAHAEAVIEGPPTALVFPGQGVQRRGLGADGRARSRVAHAVWERADAFSRERLGFSLLEVVEANPRTLRLDDGRVCRHPDGVLFRTEFTQPALLALAAAQLAELRDDGAVGDRVLAAGHSVGEFAALHALGALELEAALELVHRRGLAMQAHVPRDAAGRSPYRLAVVDPSGVDLEAAVAEASELLEIVNHNAPGRQYAVAGTEAAIAELERRLGRRAVRVLPGIDVPFHSSVLRGAVDEFRPLLAAALARLEPERLVGRWVPNLLGRPFARGDDPVELLAQQLAAPVRWIETQQALVTALGVRRVVEVAPAHAAVLTGLARMTFADAEAPPELLHAEHDRDALLERAEVSAPAAVPAGADTSVRHSAPTLPAPAADRALDAGAALELVLALQARVRLDQLDRSETLDDLFQGVSSRRNQVLIDLGREFGLSGAEGVQGQPLGELMRTLREQGAAYRFPGPYLREALGSGLSRALAPTGLTRADAEAQLALGPGLTDHVLARVVLDTRPGPSARGGDLARLTAGADLLERAVELTAADLGIALAPAAAPAPAAPVITSPHVEDALLDSARALAAALGRPFALDGESPQRDDPDRERLAILDAELGPDRAAAVAPRFDARRHVRFTSAWASARWDLVTAYHDALAGRLSVPALAEEIDRLAVHDVAETADWLAARAEEQGRPDVAGAIARTGTPPAPDLRSEIALVTGASPGSIAAELVRLLLRGGARVVVATSTHTPERRRFYRELYRTSAGPDAELHVVPANLASFADIDSLVGWLRRPGGGRRGRDDLELDPLIPTVLAPFAAMPTAGDAGDAGAASETAIRLQLLGVERLVATLADRAPLTVLLPLSPNLGAFGGDGPYGETKAGLEVLVRRARSESWGQRATLLAPRLGWVRGTGLMGANDALAPLVEERLGVRTFAPAEAAGLLIELLVAGTPHEIDLTGGLSDIADLRAALDPLAAELRERAAREARRRRLESALEPPSPSEVAALPSPGTDAAPRPLPATLTDHGLAPEDLVVIVGTGELGPGGTGATRFALELGELDSPGAVAELAWLCGLARYEVEHYRGRWIDAATGEEVPEAQLADRYADAVAGRVGVRAVEDDGTITTDGQTVLAPVTLERELAFDVATEAEARFYASEHTTILPRRRALARDSARRGASPGTADRRAHAPRRRTAPDRPRPRPLRPAGGPRRHRRPDGAREPRLHGRGVRRRRPRARGAARRRPPNASSEHARRRDGRDGVAAAAAARPPARRRASERPAAGIARQCRRRAHRAGLRRLLRTDGAPGRGLRDRGRLARGGARQDPRRQGPGRRGRRLRRPHARGDARLRRHGRDREQRRARRDGPRPGRGLARERRPPLRLRRGPGRRRAAGRARRRRARARAAGARRARLRRELRRRHPHLDPGRRPGRARERRARWPPHCSGTA